MGKRRNTTEPALAGPTLALLYRRVSSFEQKRDGVSLPMQLADTRAYVARQDGWLIHAEYEDILSGKRDDRPGYQALLAEARALRQQGKRVAVVCKWLHRLGRRVAERVRTWEELDELGVQIHSESEGGVVSAFVHNILAAVAAEEVRQLGERTRECWDNVRASGWCKVARAPFGYTLVEASEAQRQLGSTKKVLEIDSVTAPYVVEMFERIKRGDSRRSVRRWAMALPEEVRHGRNFGLSTMDDILCNPTYVARDPAGSGEVLERPMGRWPRLVEDDLWAAAQKIRQPQNPLKHQASGDYMLASILRCTRCGGRMRGMTGRNAGSRYRCGGNGVDGRPDGFCSETVNRAAVETPLLEQAAGMLAIFDLDPKARRQLQTAWSELQQRESVDTDMLSRARQQKHLQATIDKASSRITNSTRLLIDGTITREAYAGLVAEEQVAADKARAELDDLLKNAPSAPVALPSLEQALADLGNWRAILGSGTAAQQRQLLGQLLDQAVAARVSHGKYTVEATWNPLGQALVELQATLLSASRVA